MASSNAEQSKEGQRKSSERCRQACAFLTMWPILRDPRMAGTRLAPFTPSSASRARSLVRAVAWERAADACSDAGIGYRRPDTSVTSVEPEIGYRRSSEAGALAPPSVGYWRPDAGDVTDIIQIQRRGAQQGLSLVKETDTGL